MIASVDTQRGREREGEEEGGGEGGGEDGVGFQKKQSRFQLAHQNNVVEFPLLLCVVGMLMGVVCVLFSPLDKAEWLGMSSVVGVCIPSCVECKEEEGEGVDGQTKSKQNIINHNLPYDRKPEQT